MYDDILRSTQDRSMNLITHELDGGKIEARFVQRLDDTVIVYLSSMTGCNLSCRFCHLTQMRETTTTGASLDSYLEQAQDVLSLAKFEDKLDDVKIVHFNFMARGDALHNPHFFMHTYEILDGLKDIAKEYKLIPKFKISTIFPEQLIMNRSLPELKAWITKILDRYEEVEFYYSLYSMKESFRSRWLPKAMDPEYVGYLFRGTQEKLRIHHALIDGENCSIQDTHDIKKWLSDYGIKARLNIVRYNPFNRGSGQEASLGDINTYKEFMKMSPSIVDVHIISRVGEDVAASCGMFV